jgi:uncharacterized protein YbjT (DUF2867 family)
MTQQGGRIIAVVGATGLQGSAITRRLLLDGWHVRALSRDPGGKKARLLSDVGAEIVKVDTSDSPSLDHAFADAYGVFNVQNHHISGYDGEVAQGKNVADAAKRAGVAHVVYGSAGVGVRGTGVGSWETKIEIADHMKAQDLPVTVLRPTAFMELMTESKFFPPASVWHVMPMLMGSSRPIVWLAVEDLAVIAATAFADPDGFIGRDLSLASDVQSIDECRQIWREVSGRNPLRLPMPVWLFERFVGTDETTMWRWLRTNEFDLETDQTMAIHPGALSVREWLLRKRSPDHEVPERKRPISGA